MCFVMIKKKEEKLVACGGNSGSNLQVKIYITLYRVKNFFWCIANGCLCLSEAVCQSQYQEHEVVQVVKLNKMRFLCKTSHINKR